MTAPPAGGAGPAPAPLPSAVQAFMASPQQVAGKVNGRALEGPALQRVLAELGPLEVIGHLARGATDVSVTWRTQRGVTGATRFTLDAEGHIQAVAARWAGL